MANESRKKRKTAEPNEHSVKRPRNSDSEATLSKEATAGKIKRVFVRNFMCHDALEIILNENVNFIVGRNGSGKSAILTALVVGLGARAKITSRGTSIKEFIKKGRNSALIEITLANQGVNAYKPEIYGKTIIVSRVIGSGSGYKIKSSQGEIISTKKDELEHIITTMNIQVENPISILNQDVSKEFLVTAGPKKKYELFMQATQLDKIGANYKRAQILSEEARQHLKENEERITTTKKEVDELENNIHMLESIDGVRAEHDALENELFWSMALDEEAQLQRIQMSLEEHKNNVENHTEEIKSKGDRENHIIDKIAELKEKIQDIENEAAGSSDLYATRRKALATKRADYSDKYTQWRSAQNEINRWEKDISTLRKEIKQREAENNQSENKKHEVKTQLEALEVKLKEVDALICTKNTELIHLEAEKGHLSQEERTIKADRNQKTRNIREKKSQLNGRKQESNNAVTVFGPDMPRLLKRIKEEFDRGRFKQMPHGPLGLYTKVRDPAWVPAVEDFLGAGYLRSFCVDNAQDAKTLSLIMKEVYRNGPAPQIITSKFHNKVHDVRRHCTQASGYYNLLEAMEFSDPIVANCLIDQRGIECILLIPTSREACDILSHAHNVPPNCKRAFTQQGDTFFPDPNYRTYGGSRGMRARYLQVSTTEAIKLLEEELHTTEEDLRTIIKKHDSVQQNLQKAHIELTKCTKDVSQLSDAQQKIRAKINELRDKCQTDDQNSVDVFKTDLRELIKQVSQATAKEQHLKAETDELHKEAEALEAEVREYKNLAHCLDVKLDPFKRLIREQEKELQMIRVNSQHDERRLEEAKNALQKVTADLEIQQRKTSKMIGDAAARCPRIETRRSPTEINRRMKELRYNIAMVENQFGSKEDLNAELQKKRKKYDDIVEFANDIEKSNNKQLERLKERRRLYQTMKKQISAKVQRAFQSILVLRRYQGKLKIDHNEQVLILEVNPKGSAKRTTNDARSLSGGERSYSTVAFILALWESTEVPFYFLDEFDVFMDKVNRRVIMDILLDHAREHPNNQFAFLTPLDTSNVLAEKYVTIHQLASPERSANGLQQTL